jgi:hypothetical protein
MNDHVFEDPMRNIKLSPNAITVEKTSKVRLSGVSKRKGCYNWTKTLRLQFETRGVRLSLDFKDNDFGRI